MNNISQKWVIGGVILVGIVVVWYVGSMSDRPNPSAQTPSVIGLIDLECRSNFNTDNGNLDECGTMQSPLLLSTKEGNNVSSGVAIPSAILCRRSGNDCVGLLENQINTIALCDTYQSNGKGALCDSSLSGPSGNQVAATFCAYGSNTQFQCVSRAILQNGNPANPLRACGLNTFTEDRCVARYGLPTQQFCLWNNALSGQKCLPNPSVSCDQNIVNSINNLPDMTQKILTCQAHNCRVVGDNSLATPCGLPGNNQTGQQSVTDIMSALTTMINNAQQNANGLLQELIALQALLDRLNN